ncbi:MAG TPA: metallophosphoesterase [Solirubrobacterales bacterium]|nr:metallophosphoesterase [Solirubrobacterales bacterium]
MPLGESDQGGTRVRVAAAGDLHCSAANRDGVLAAFASLEGVADLALLAGDLTGEGRLEEAEVLAEAAADAQVPVLAVLGNHDHHHGEAEAIVECLRRAGIIVLERAAERLRIGQVEVGVVGAKGFVGGFAPRHLPDFGEASLRAVYAETTAEVEALDAGLREIAPCPLRIVLLHYAPVEETLEGEPREIFVFLGSDRLAAPVLEHGPDLVVHGHAHAGAADGRIGATPVHNVSIPVIGRDFRVFELEAGPARSAIR